MKVIMGRCEDGPMFAMVGKNGQLWSWTYNKAEATRLPEAEAVSIASGVVSDWMFNVHVIKG